MSTPFFSIVIPTLRGSATLESTLSSCLHQENGDFEVIVSNNGGDSGVASAVERASSPSIRLVSPPRLLAMTDHWEFAVSHSRGQYVTVLGDDDALLPRALSTVRAHIEKTGKKAIRWNKLIYFYPDSIRTALRNKLFVRPDPLSGSVRFSDVALDIAEGRLYYEMLPMIYNSFVHRDLIGRAASELGRVFATTIPDVFSGFAFAHYCEEYLSIPEALSVSGKSAKSNGDHTHHSPPKSRIAEEFSTLNESARLEWHRSVPDIPTLATTVAQSYQTARDNVFPSAGHRPMNMRPVIKRAFRQIIAPDGETLDRYVEICRAVLSDPDDLHWFETNERYLRKLTYASRWTDVSLSWLGLNLASFGISDAWGAAELYSRFAEKRIWPGAETSYGRRLVDAAYYRFGTPMWRTRGAP